MSEMLNFRQESFEGLKDSGTNREIGNSPEIVIREAKEKIQEALDRFNNSI